MLLNDLLDFSRLDVGRFEIETKPFPLRRTIDEAMHILALRAEEKGLALSCIWTPRFPTTWRATAGVSNRS